MKERKNEKLKNEGKKRISILISMYTVHFAFLKVYTKFEKTCSNRNREICDRYFYWKERKMNKKGTDKQYVAGLLLYNTTIKETKSATMNIFRFFFYFLFKSFVKAELS